MLERIIVSKQKRCKIGKKISNQSSSLNETSHSLETSFSLPHSLETSSLCKLTESSFSPTSSKTLESTNTDHLMLSHLLCQWRDPDFPFFPKYPNHFTVKNQLFFEINYPGIDLKTKEIKFIS